MSNKKRVKNRRKYKNKKARVSNATIVRSSGQGQRQDLARSGRVSRASSHPFDRFGSSYLRAVEWSELFYKEWTARKIVTIPVQDMLRKGWEVSGLSNEQQEIYDEGLKRLDFKRTLRQALVLERLVGGSAMILGLEGLDSTKADEELNPQLTTPNQLKFCNVISRTKMSSTRFVQDPLKPDFGRPHVYQVWGTEVHASRMLIFDGEPVTDNETNDLGFIKRDFDGFGESVLAPIYDDIIRSAGSRQAATQLIQRASVLLIQNQDYKAQVGTRTGEEKIATLDNMADQMSMYQAAMIDGKSVNLDQWSASFGSVPELLLQYLQILAAASDIPATRFLSQAPGGLNATGDSDLENYYNMIDDRRESRLRPRLEQFHDVFIRSVLPGVDPKSVEITFPPLWNPSRLEETQAELNEATTINALVAGEIITREHAQSELKERKILKVDFDEFGEDLPNLDDTNNLLDDLTPDANSN